VRAEELLEQRALVSPAHTAVVCGASRTSYSALNDQAARFAATLLRGGLRPGDRVAICADNSVEAVIALFGVLKAGGVFVMVSPQSPVEYVNRLVADGDAAATVTREQTGALKVTWRLTAGESAAAVDTDLAALVYTSGSTGEPKGVMLTHRNLTSAAASIAQYLKLTDADVILSVLPLAFTYGLGQVTTAFHVGATLVIERSFTYPRVILDTIRRERVTGLPIVPTMATLLLQHDLRALRLSSLRYITNAAAALSTVKLQQLQAALPRVSFYSMYGQTECQRVSYLPPALIADHPDSVGVPIPGTDAFVVDDHGQPVPAGVVGELVVRGPHVMKGYWKQPVATSDALRPGPGGATVLYTGDLFRMDADGLLYFVERKDGMIKSRGEKVAPRQVEAIIARLNGVADVAVYGVPDNVTGEAVVAAVVPVPGASLTADDVRRHCREHLAAYMVPKVVDIRETIPTTVTGKISRRALSAMAQAGETAA
jgi:long-chain acyl-CoA synthetase